MPSNFDLLVLETRLYNLCSQNPPLLEDIPDACRCPFTGLKMVNPVKADDGITYEEQNLKNWMQTNGRISPVSGIALTSPVVNRALRNLLEELTLPDNTTVDQGLITRIRLQATLHWITKSKIDIPDGVFRGYNLQYFYDGWPLIIDTAKCVELAWNALPRLRLLVYAQFQFVVNADVNSMKTVIKNHFVNSMTSHLYEGKSKQIISALEAFVHTRPHLTAKLNEYKRSELLRGWYNFWNEFPPVQYSGDDLYERHHTQRMIPSNRGGGWPPL